jgi:orotidine-5'-phosphate decarboxylase
LEQEELVEPQISKDHLSTKPIPVRDRLIFALDVASTKEAMDYVERLGESVSFYKLGLQIFMAGGYYDLIERLKDHDKQVFVDLKFFDVPETVSSAVKQLQNRGVTFTTVHGNDGILDAAVKAAAQQQSDAVKVLAVTVLTSLDQHDLKDLGFECSVENLVLSRAKRALELGCAGVISSGLEAAGLRDELGDDFLIVTPGIRPVENIEGSDDQKRVVDVEKAFLSGADYVVIGRPIRNATDPFKKAMEYQDRISRLFR